MERIIVATDFSARSERAVRRAAAIAGRVGASLTIAHVVDGDRPDRLVDAERAAAMGLLDEIAGNFGNGIAVTPLIKVDDVASGILDAADEAGADLVVIGPHRSRLMDVFVGTTVERVVRRCRTAVLVAVQESAIAYGRTLLALDFDEASRSAGRAALEMGLFDHGHTIVMHAFDAPAEGMMMRAMEPSEAIGDYLEAERGRANRRLETLVAELGLPPSGRLVVAIDGSPARTILAAARTEDAQLIVVGTSQRKGFERLLIGSVTEDVIRDAHRDILIVPIEP